MPTTSSTSSIPPSIPSSTLLSTTSSVSSTSLKLPDVINWEYDKIYNGIMITYMQLPESFNNLIS
jgi:hypothetical protein